MEQVSFKQLQEKKSTLVMCWKDCHGESMGIYEIESDEKITWIRTCFFSDEMESGGYKCFVEDILTFEQLKETLEWINDKWNWELGKPYWEMMDVIYPEDDKQAKVFKYDKLSENNL